MLETKILDWCVILAAVNVALCRWSYEGVDCVYWLYVGDRDMVLRRILHYSSWEMAYILKCVKNDSTIGVIYNNKSAYLTTFGSCAVPTTFHSTFSMSDDDLPHTISLGMLWSLTHSPPTEHNTKTPHFIDSSCVTYSTKPVKHKSAHTNTQRTRHIRNMVYK